MQDSSRVAQPIAYNKGKKPIAPNDVDTLVDDELSSGSSPSLNLSSAKNARESTKTRSCKRPRPHPALSDTASGASCRERREASRRQNRLDQAPRNSLVLPLGMLPPMPPVHPTFSARPTFYIPPVALIRRSDDMPFSPLG